MEPPGKGQRYLSEGMEISEKSVQFVPSKTDINMDEIFGKVSVKGEIISHIFKKLSNFASVIMARWPCHLLANLA